MGGSCVGVQAISTIICHANIGSISFKRKASPKRTLPSFLAPIRTVFQGDSDGLGAEPVRSRGPVAELPDASHDFGHGENGNTNLNGKDGHGIDWYSEAPRRRVGYEDLTTIDWIFEYTKERQRLRSLRSKAIGIFGQLQQLYDASQIWIVLVLIGISAGLLAASIDIASDWLGDLKTGYCHPGEGGGKFYLNKAFCCFGHAELVQCTDWTTWPSALHVSSSGGRYVTSYAFFVLYSVVFATSAALLVKFYAPYARQSGIPEIKTMLGGFVMQRFLGTWTLVTKSVGIVLSVSSGLWLGKEGPLVHIACCCANMWMKLWPSLYGNEARKREVLSAAASAGISVAFGAPVGGVLFSLEQLSYYFPDKTMWQSFVCAMVAGATLQALNPFRSGKLVLYEVKYSSGWHSFELLPFMFLGICGGFFGAVFVKLNMAIASWRRQSETLQNFPVLETAVVALLTALVNYPNVFMRAQSTELVATLFAECRTVTDDQFGICETGLAVAKTISALLAAAFLGLLFTSVTFGLRVPAGIILPSMTMGALGGRAVGIIVETIQLNHPTLPFFSTCEPDIACVTPGVYAVVGAAAALGGVTRMTVSIVVIMFELTGALTYVLPIMIAVMLSKWVADAFSKIGIYESWININEYPYLGNENERAVPDVYASQVMTPADDLATITAIGHTILSLQEFLATNPFRGFPVVAESGNLLLGYITRAELTYALKSATVQRSLAPNAEVYLIHQPAADPTTTLDLRPWMDQMPITLNSRSTLALTMDMFLKLGIKNMLFCDQGHLVGMLTKKDLWYILSHTAEFGDNETSNNPAGRAGLQRNENLFSLESAEDEQISHALNPT